MRVTKIEDKDDDGEYMVVGEVKVSGPLASVVSLLRGFNWRAPALANNPHLSAGELLVIFTHSQTVPPLFLFPPPTSLPPG